MKKIFVVLVIVGLILGLCSCADRGVIPTSESGKHNSFKAVSDVLVFDSNPMGAVFVDEDTGVLYWISSGRVHTLTMLVNADGSPKLWQGGEKHTTQQEDQDNERSVESGDVQ